MSSRRILVLVLVSLALLAPAGVDAGWMANGNLVCGAYYFQLSPVMVPDGAGGAIISWFDCRRSAYETDIYAQRINGQGYPLWAPDGVGICTESGNQIMPVMAPDGSGGAIIVWIDTRLFDYDIFAQRVNGAGQGLWGRGGSIVNIVLKDQLYPAVVSDGEGGAIVTYLHEVLEPENKKRTDVYAQRLNVDGGWMMWDDEGIPICTSLGYQIDPCIVSDGHRGAIIGWIDQRGDPPFKNIFAQRVTSEGGRLWLTNGAPVCQTMADQEGLVMTSDNLGGAIFAWYDHTEVNLDIYVARLDGDANPLWGINGTRITSSPTHQRYPVICSDGGAGAYVAWVDERADKDVYAQHVDGSGVPSWPGDGVVICDFETDQKDLAIVPDNLGGAIISWIDYRDEFPTIYAQRINAAGEVLWEHNGVLVTRSEGGKYSNVLAQDGSGGAIAAWSDDRDGETDIYAQWIRGDGKLVATEVERWGASFVGDRVNVSWTLSELSGEASFEVSRAIDGARPSFAALPGIAEREGRSFAFADPSAEPGSSYRYRVAILEADKRRTLFETGSVRVPAMPLTLQQNHPNPFNPSTEIRFYLPESGRVTLAVYDVHGSLVRMLEDGARQRGFHAIAWDGRNERGEQAASGVYLCRLRAGKETLSRKMVLMR